MLAKLNGEGWEGFEYSKWKIKSFKFVAITMYTTE
jgi:hypothetical protein